MEKGCFNLDSDPVPPYHGRNGKLVSFIMEFKRLARNFLSSPLWLVYFPSKYARIPQAVELVENEPIRLTWCFIFLYVLNFLFMCFFLFPFLNESMADISWVWFRRGTAFVLIVMAFWTFMFIVSLLLDFIVGILGFFISTIALVASLLDLFYFRFPNARKKRRLNG